MNPTPTTFGGPSTPRSPATPLRPAAALRTEGLRVMVAGGLPAYRALRIVDAVEFTATHLLDRLPVGDRLDRVVLHPTCSAQQMGLTPALRSLAAAVADDVAVPDSWGCCGFAGDRGLLHPELTAAATAPQAAEIATIDADAHASCNRTCELGMSRATGESYVHVLELLERATRA